MVLQPYIVFVWLRELPPRTTLVWGTNRVSPADERTPQPSPPSHCLKMIPPNEVSRPWLFSRTPPLNQVFVPVLDVASTTIPPVRFDASQPVWNVTQGGW